MIISVDSGYWMYGIYIGIDRRQIRGEPASPFSYWGSTGQSPFFCRLRRVPVCHCHPIYTVSSILKRIR